jgi:hypothetical protein
MSDPEGSEGRTRAERTRRADRPRRGGAWRAVAVLAALASLLSAGCGAKEALPGARPLAEIHEAMRTLAAAYPELASVSALGYGASLSLPGGDPAYHILALELGSAPTGSFRPAVQLVGAIHGDEEVGAELAIAVAEDLCASYGSDGASTRLLDGFTLTVIPVANPWGYELGSRNNALSVDLNRNFPWGWGYEGWDGAAPLDQPESRVLADNAADKRYTLSIALHTGARRISVPWDYIGTTWSWSPQGAINSYTLGDYIDLYSPAHALFAARGAAYAALVESATGSAPGSYPVVQGFDWYFAGGTLADWLYGEMGCAAYTVELSTLKDWKERTASQAHALIDEHEAAILALLASAGAGARGRVLDSSGNGAEARVEARPSIAAKVPGPDPVEYLAFALSGGSSGRFLVPLPSGYWELTAARISDGATSASAIVYVNEYGSSEEATLLLP